MKRIILPTDFSKNAENAMVYALNLFKDEKCVFYLLNTFMPSVQEEYPWHTDLEDSDPQKSLKKLATLLDLHSKKFKNTKHLYIPHSAMNTVVDEIRKIIKKENIDLVVMGTQGLTDLKDILFGTNTIQVIKNVACPVIAVPSGVKHKAPKKILFPTDFEIAYSKELLKELLYIAKHNQSHISVLHVSSPSGLTGTQLDNKSRLEEILKGVDHDIHINHGEDTRSAINDFQVNNKINFLVMIRNKHTFMERLFLRSEIKQIGLHIGVPFMVIPCLP